MNVFKKLFKKNKDSKKGEKIDVLIEQISCQKKCIKCGKFYNPQKSSYISTSFCDNCIIDYTTTELVMSYKTNKK